MSDLILVKTNISFVYEVCLLGCDALHSIRSLPTFYMNLLPPSSPSTALQIEVVYASEVLVNLHHTAVSQPKT